MATCPASVAGTDRAAASEAELQRQRRAEEEAKEREAQEAARSWEKLEDSKIFSKDLRDL